MRTSLRPRDGHDGDLGDAGVRPGVQSGCAQAELQPLQGQPVIAAAQLRGELQEDRPGATPKGPDVLRGIPAGEVQLCRCTKRGTAREQKRANAQGPRLLNSRADLCDRATGRAV